MNHNPISIEEATELYLSECQKGAAPDIHLFVEKYPHLDKELREILPLMQELQRLPESQFSECDEFFFDNLIPADSDFRVLKELKSGGMGVVFEGVQLSLNRKVAIKFLSVGLQDNAKLRTQFEKEAKLIALLHHPNIVKVLSASFTTQYCYYVMEYVDGSNLHNTKAGSAKNVASVGLAAARALAYAHSCGILHRDIKPANILLDKDGVVKLCDFGLADTIRQNEDYHSDSEQSFCSGTLRYMAPEKIAEKNEDELSDQYSLGATLYEYATGKPLFDGHSRQQMKELMGRSITISKICEDEDLSAIIRKSLNPSPSGRYKSMSAMAEDFQRYLEHKPVYAKKHHLIHRLRLWGKRKPIAAIFAAISILSVLIAIFVGVAGYKRTVQALDQVQTNAKLADEILTEIFSSIPERQQTETNKKLLISLLPYYKKITRNTNLPDEQLYRANAILCDCATRCGDLAVAESSAEFMLRCSPCAQNMTRLASILLKQGKQPEAAQLYRKCVSLYADSPNKADRAEAVSALLALSKSPQNQEYTQALQILKKLNAEAPNNPEYAFRYACLLAANPNHLQQIKLDGMQANAFLILLQLAEKYHNRIDFGTELIKITLKRIRNNVTFIQIHATHIKRVLTVAELLLAQYPGDISLLKNYIQLHNVCRREYLRLGYDVQARKLTDRTTAVLEFLFFMPETSGEVRTFIINFQLSRLEKLAKTERAESTRELTDKIVSELPYINSSQKESFLHKLKAIAPDAGSMNSSGR